MVDESFAAFVREHGAELLRFGYLLTGDAGRAEDVVQDALVRVMRRWRSEAPTHPLAYTRKAVVNEYLGWRRRRSSTEVVGTDWFDAGVADPTEALAERDFVWRLIGRLSPQSRAVLVLRYYEQLPDREIAALLGCAEATVRSTAARAFAALRTHRHLSALAEEKT